MGLFSWIAGLFSSGDKSSPPSDEGLEKLSSAPPGIGSEGAPSGATMVLSTVPSYTAWLVVRKGANQGSVYDLKEGRMTIGSDAGNDVQLEHASVSESHGMIRVNQDSYLLFDMGSSEGTWLNGSPVTGVPLSDGGRIAIGGSELFYTKVGEGEEQGVILVRSGPSSGKSFPVGDADIVIGRQPGEGGAQLDDSAISQRHALVRPTNEGCMIRKLQRDDG